MRLISAKELGNLFEQYPFASAVSTIQIGPRKEVVLFFSDSEVFEAVRFGNIQAFPAVVAKFRQFEAMQSEIGYLGPDPETVVQKTGRWRIALVAERRSFQFSFVCGSISIGPSLKDRDDST